MDPRHWFYKKNHNPLLIVYKIALTDICQNYYDYLSCKLKPEDIQLFNAYLMLGINIKNGDTLSFL